MRPPLSRLTNSFKNAGKGLFWCYRTQPNLVIHTLLAMAAVVVGATLRIERGEWLILLLTIISVFVAEFFNTALEVVTDALKLHKRTDEDDHYIMVAKDIAAAAVLLTVFTALVVGSVIFLPRLIPFYYVIPNLFRDLYKF